VHYKLGVSTPDIRHHAVLRLTPDVPPPKNNDTTCVTAPQNGRPRLNHGSLWYVIRLRSAAP